MDHSLHAYLRRQPVETLGIILLQYLQSPQSYHCEEIIRTILEIICEHEYELSDNLACEINAYRKENTKNMSE